MKAVLFPGNKVVQVVDRPDPDRVLARCWSGRALQPSAGAT